MFLLVPPSAWIHHFTSTRSLCGPENRPNPLGPGWHQVTHIVRFATHLAQKSNIWTSQSSKKGTSVNCSNSIGNHLKNLLIETNSSVHTIRLSISNLPPPMWEDLKTNEGDLLVGNRPKLWFLTTFGFDLSYYCKDSLSNVQFSYHNCYVSNPT